MQNKFLIKFKNTIPSKNKDKNLTHTLSKLKKANSIINPTTILIKTCEELAPGASLLPRVRAGRVFYIPGKIKYLSSMYKGLKWIIDAVKNPNRMILTERINLELKNIQKNTGESINQKRTFIKELRAARLNARRRKYFNKFIRKKTYRRMQNRKNKKLKKKYKKLKIKKTFRFYKFYKKKKRRRYQNKLYKIKKNKKRKIIRKFFLKKKSRKNRKSTYTKKKYNKLKLSRRQKKNEEIRIAWYRIEKKEKSIKNA